jgi:hypothetical protein
MAESTYHIGDRVEETTRPHRRGVVVHQYKTPGIECLVAVRFDGEIEAPRACHVDDLRRVVQS